MAIPPLVLRIYADSSGVKKGVAQAQTQVGGMRGAIQKNSALIKTALIGGVVVGLKLSVDAAREAATAQLALRNSIANSKSVTAGATAEFTKQADALRDLTGVDDEAIIGAQSLLVQMGLTEDQVKSLVPRIVDLSVKMGIDMTTAAKAVGKSVNGTTGGLQKLGVVVDKTKASSDAYGATLDALGVAQGFAAKQAKLEPWKVLGAQFEELAEVIGEAILPVLRGVANVLRGLIPVLRPVGKLLPLIAAGFATWWTVGKIATIAGAIGKTSTVLTGLGSAALTAQPYIIALTAGLVGLKAIFDTTDEPVGRFSERLVKLGYDAQSAAKFVNENYTKAVDAAGGKSGAAAQNIALMIKKEEEAAAAAKIAGKHQRDYANDLEKTKDKVAQVQRALHKFAGMTGPEQRKWATDAMGNFDAVGTALDNLADKAKLTADKIIHQFQRQATNIANYRTNLQTVASRNIPDEILQQLIDLGLGGAGIMAQLARASDAEFAKIVGSMKGARDQTNGLKRDLNNLRREAERDIIINVRVQKHGQAGLDYDFRQHGGPVTAGRGYIVGEAGPELFVPRQSGDIVPNHGLIAGEGGDTTIIVKVGEDTLARVVEKGLNRAASRH